MCGGNRQFDRIHSNNWKWWVMMTQYNVSCSFFSFSQDTINLFSCVCVSLGKLSFMQRHIKISELCSWGHSPCWRCRQTHLWRWIWLGFFFTVKKHKTKSDMLLNTEHNTVLASQRVSAEAWSLISLLPLHPWLPSSHLQVLHTCKFTLIWV